MKTTTEQMIRFWNLVKTGDITEDLFQRFLEFPNGVERRNMSFVLHQHPKIIKELLEEAQFAYPREKHGYSFSKYTDDSYPVLGSGFVPVRYSLIPGEEIENSRGYVSSKGISQYFEPNGLRVATVAEALLPFAKDPQLGLGRKRIVVYVHSEWPQLVIGSKHGERYIHPDSARYGSESIFLAVWKEPLVSE